MKSFQSLYAGFLVWACFLLTLCLRAILDRRPFVLRGYWFAAVLTIGVSPAFIRILVWSLRPGNLDLVISVLVVLFGISSALMWREMNGYVVLGVNRQSLNEALRSALRTNNLAFTESGSDILLTATDQRIKVSVQRWIGTGWIKATPRGRLLRTIGECLGRYLSETPWRTRVMATVAYGVAGLTVACYSVYILTID